MATEVGEDTQIKANLAFMAKTVSAVVIATYSYVTIKSDIDEIRNDNIRIHHEVDMNSEFRVKWPRGELGALPDDAEQNMRLSFLENQITKHSDMLDKIRYSVSD